jgi:eukaryotic-like serine/threonine-protein kinase
MHNYAATGREPFGSGSLPSVLYRVVHSQPDADGIAEPLLSLWNGVTASFEPAS